MLDVAAMLLMAMTSSSLRAHCDQLFHLNRVGRMWELSRALHQEEVRFIEDIIARSRPIHLFF
jgi:glycerol-3-phosphate dehydrogenase